METLTWLMSILNCLLIVPLIVDMNTAIDRMEHALRRQREQWNALRERYASLSRDYYNLERSIRSVGQAIEHDEGVLAKRRDELASYAGLAPKFIHVTNDFPIFPSETMYAVSIGLSGNEVDDLAKARWGESRKMLVWAGSRLQAHDLAARKYPPSNGYTVGAALEVNPSEIEAETGRVGAA